MTERYVPNSQSTPNKSLLINVYTQIIKGHSTTTENNIGQRTASVETVLISWNSEIILIRQCLQDRNPSRYEAVIYDILKLILFVQNQK